MAGATATGNNLADFVPRLHETIVGGSATWSGGHHPPALVLERGHFSLEVSSIDAQPDCMRVDGLNDGSHVFDRQIAGFPTIAQKKRSQ